MIQKTVEVLMKCSLHAKFENSCQTGNQGKFSRNAMYAYLLFSCFMFRHVKAFFLYRNEAYIFPILGLAK